MSDVITTHRLGEAAVLKMLTAAVQAAHDSDAPAGIAIVDAGGTLVAWVLTDGGSPLASDVATKKARTAAFTGYPTGGMPTSVASELASAADDFTNLPGGFPIAYRGETLGGISASSRSAEADIAIAEAGLRALDFE